MRQERAVTLVELLIAISLIGALVIVTTGIGNSFYAIKRDLLDKQQSSIQGNLAMATIFERVLRAATITSGAAFTISNNGKTLQYAKSGATETIWLDENTNTIKYNDGSSERVILNDVMSLNFFQDYQSRLAVNLTLSSGENFRTAVQPRNQFTPRGIIN